jgi:hypothetical protein
MKLSCGLDFVADSLPKGDNAATRSRVQECHSSSKLADVECQNTTSVGYTFIFSNLVKDLARQGDSVLDWA